MVMTESTMLPLGTQAPDFSLPDTDGRTVSLKELQGHAAQLVVFMCNHCPFVIHIREGLAQFARDYQDKDLAMVAINSNNIATHPDDSPERMKADKERFAYAFPYLYDETQEVAKAYTAACTPDFFLFDKDSRLVYRGQFDASRPGNEFPVTGEDLRAAVDALLDGQEVASDQKPSIGCNIKWKPGNEPDYFK